MQPCQPKAGVTALCEPTDQELVERVRAGDNTLYGMLIHRYHRRLYCVALRILRNDADAEDALQDAYILGLTRINQFAGRSSFYTWMARITMNEAFTRIRGRRRAERLETAASAPGNAHHLFAGVPTPEAAMFDREIDHAFTSSVRALPENYRKVFAMRELEELSTAEAASRLGVTEECIKTRLHRAREFLKRRLAPRMRPWMERAAA